MATQEDKKILIIVPAYNEADNIKKAVNEIRSLSCVFDIIVINDGSLDDTALCARQAGVDVISLPFNLGIGGAIQAAFKYGRKKGYDVVARIDGDGQHNASYLGKLIEPVLTNSIDIAVGSRFIPPFLGYRSSFIRRIGILFFARLISALTGCRVTDPTSGFRAYSKAMIELFAENYPHDFPEPEEIMIARRHGARVHEVAVEMRKRLAGHSSIRYIATLYYMIKVTFAILLDMLKRTKK